MLNDYGSEFIKVEIPQKDSFTTNKRNSKHLNESQKFINSPNVQNAKASNYVIDTKHISSPTEIKLPPKIAKKPELKSKSFCIDLAELQMARSSLGSNKLPTDRQTQALSRISNELNADFSHRFSKDNDIKSLIEARERKSLSISEIDRAVKQRSILLFESDQNVGFILIVDCFSSYLIFF